MATTYTDPLVNLGSISDDAVGDRNGFEQTIFGNGGYDIIRFALDYTFGSIYGGPAGDELYGGLGSDLLDGEDGNDLMFGCDPSDTTIVDGDTFYGGEGTDLGYGLNGSDRFFGGEDRDAFFGGPDNDGIWGEDGDDTFGTIQVGAPGGFITQVGLFGGDGNDYINGGAGSDELFGDADNDSLYGESGDDAMNGGTGADKMTGGSGEDFYVVDNSGDRVIETDSGKGDIIATSINLTLPANVEDGGAIGDAGSINLTGNDLENTLFGNSKANKLRGLGDDDDIRADGGHDILVGGKGKDKLAGEAGRDYFDFDSITESRKGSNRDVITDFSRSQNDRIDLRSIDADTSANSGNDTFKFIGTASFNGGGGEVRCKSGVVQADVNGDKVADLEIKINLSTLSKGDFLL